MYDIYIYIYMYVYILCIYRYYVYHIIQHIILYTHNCILHIDVHSSTL